MEIKTSDKKSDAYSDFIKDKHERLFNTDQAIIDSVVFKVTDSKIALQEKIMKGEANEVYSVVTESGQEVIVRISHHKNPRFQPEKWALDECRKLGIPVPEVLHIESFNLDNKKIEVCVESKLSGTPVKELREGLSEGEVAVILRKAGEILSRINSIKVEGFGDLDENGRGEYKTIQEVLDSHHLDQNEMLETAENISLDTEIVKKAFRIIRGANLSNTTEARLLHNDFAPKHILVKGDNITGILDFETVEGGDPIREFARWTFYFGSSWPVQYLKEGYTDKSIFTDDFDEKLKLWRIYFGLSSLDYYVKEGNQVGVGIQKRDSKKILIRSNNA